MMNTPCFRDTEYLASDSASKYYSPLTNNEAGHNEPNRFEGLTEIPENLHYESIEKIHNYFQNKENTTPKVN